MNNNKLSPQAAKRYAQLQFGIKVDNKKANVGKME